MARSPLDTIRSGAARAPRTLLLLSLLGLFACGEKKADAATSAGASASGAAASGGGTKTCPDGASFCFDLPAGFTAQPLQPLKVGGTMSVADAGKTKTVTLVWGPAEQFNSRKATVEMNNKGGKTEELAGGAGTYFEKVDGNVKWSQSVVKTSSEAVQCTGRQPSDGAGGELAELCRSVRAK